MEPCTVNDIRKLDLERNGSWWLGDPLDPAVAAGRYPHRQQVNYEALSVVARKTAAKNAARDIEELLDIDHSFHPPAIAHFEAIRLEHLDEDEAEALPREGPTYDVHLNDFVLVSIRVDDANHHTKVKNAKAQVVELYAAPDGSRRVVVHWFYDAVETGLVSKDGLFGAMEIDDSQVWRERCRGTSSWRTDYDVAFITGPILIHRVHRGDGNPLPPPQRGHYWWSEEMEQQFFTYELPLEEMRSKETWAGKERVLRKMDVFCGAGGLGYMGQQDLGRLKIVNQWGIDYDADMAATFKGNFRSAHVVCSGSDEWLVLCQEVFALYSTLANADPRLKAIMDAPASEASNAQDDDKLVARPRSLVLEGTHSGKSGEAEVGAEGGDDGEHEEPEEPADSDTRAFKRPRTDTNGAGPSGSKPPAATKKKKQTVNGKSRAAAAAPVLFSPLLSDDDDSGSDSGDTADGEDVVSELVAVRLVDWADRKCKQSGVASNQLSEFIGPECRYLEFRVRWRGHAEDADTWEPLQHLDKCPKVVAKFMHRLRANQLIPFPGDVDMLVGGPPCQGVSGNNRHAAYTDILKDPRNRQLLVFLEMVKFWRPKYLLMENVQDILKKENGAYIKYAVAQLLNEQYLTRQTMVAAGMYGVAQGRWRVFLWAAHRGEQLPAFPEPTHKCPDFRCTVCDFAQKTVMGSLSPASAVNAYPPVLLGDVLGDLPEVSNFELGDRSDWTCEPQTIPQAWLRRKPMPWATTVEDRLQFHAEYSSGGRKLNEQLLAIGEKKGLTALGREFMCGKNPLVKSKNPNKRMRTDGMDSGTFTFETIQASLLSLVPDPTEREVVWKTLKSSRDGYANTVGREVMARLREYFAHGADAHGGLPDHRPLCCNTDDYLRMKGVPERRHLTDESSYRDLQGVVVHCGTHTTCAGHTHNARDEGKSNCAGGGAHDKAGKASRGTKEGRVDQADADGWRGPRLLGCPSHTVLMSTGDLLCPRWCITFKGGKGFARTACFGRVHDHEIVATVVGRAEPHDMRIVHPRQDRVLTIREMARCQGFPDYHVICGEVPVKRGVKWVRNVGLKQRYQQMGNAVSPAVAAALGRCLALAALGESPPGEPVVSVPDPAYDALVEEMEADAIGFYYEGLSAAEKAAIPIPCRLLLDGAAGLAGEP